MRLMFGVLFSGMGIYAATQLGVLRALEENGLAPTVLVGVGTGAMIAGLYACKPDSREVLAVMREACGRGKGLFDPDRRGLLWTLSAGSGFQGLMRGDRLTALLDEQTDRRTLGELRTSLAIPTLALPTRKTLVFASQCPVDDGEAVWTQQAPVSLAIRAAMSVPALVRPAVWMGVPLVGAIGMGTAMSVLQQLKVKHALCVDAGLQRPKGRLDIWDIAALSNGAQDRATPCPQGWHLLVPRVPENIRASTLTSLELCAEIGYGAALETISRIKANIGSQQGKMLSFPKGKRPIFVEKD